MVIVRLASSDARDRSVFVADGTFRARTLRVLGYVTGALLLLWLAALIAGAVGAGRLPAVPLPAIGALREAPAAHASPSPSQRGTVPAGALLQYGPAAGSAADPERPAGSAPARLHGAAPGLDLGSRHPAVGGLRPRRSGQPASGAQPQPAPAAPGATTPAPPSAQGGGTSPPAHRPPAASGRSKAPPANRPVDPPAGGTSTTPPATRPVDPPAAPPGTTRASTAN